MSACDCGKPIGKRNKTGICRSCRLKQLNADPEFQRRRDAGNVRRWADPVKRAQQATLCRLNVRRRDAKPGMRDKYVEHGKRVGLPVLTRPDVQARAHRAEAVADRAIKSSATKLSWCPPEYRDDYRRLSRMHGMTAATAKAMILAQIKVDIERLSPFERQQRALERGAQLVANDIAPSLANPGNYGERKWA